MARSKRSSTARKRDSISPQSTQIIQQQLANAQRRIAAGHISVQQRFSGPLPPPDVLREYEELYPGITQFHWRLYEEQVHHRQSMEKRQLESEIR